ncbi:MAG: hypothetical protein R3C19_23595 [Planctomycetaceae bacterium]
MRSPRRRPSVTPAAVPGVAEEPASVAWNSVESEIRGQELQRGGETELCAAELRFADTESRVEERYSSTT